MEKFEKPENAVSGCYLPLSFGDKAIEDINNADEIEASEDFVFGFASAITFVCNPPDAETHGMETIKYIENSFGHFYDRRRKELIIEKIKDALNGSGFDVCIGEITLGGDR